MPVKCQASAASKAPDVRPVYASEALHLAHLAAAQFVGSQHVLLVLRRQLGVSTLNNNAPFDFGAIPHLAAAEVVGSQRMLLVIRRQLSAPIPQEPANIHRGAIPHLAAAEVVCSQRMLLVL